MSDTKRIEHPSYALISASRGSGSTKGMFRNEMNGNQSIKITLSQAYVHENPGSKGDNHVMPAAWLAEIELTPLQWAEFVSTMNQGVGTPCTLGWLTGHGRIERPKHNELARAHRIADALEQDIGEMTRFVKKANTLASDILAKGAKMKAADREKLSGIVSKMARFIGESMPYAVKRIEESVNEMTAQARATVQAEAAARGVEQSQLQVPHSPTWVVDPESGTAKLALPTENDTVTSPAVQEAAKVAVEKMHKPKAPLLPEREIETKAHEDLSTAELAELITRELRKREKMQGLTTQIHQGRRLFEANATPGPRHGSVDVCTVSYQGRRTLIHEESLMVLRTLQQGGSVEVIYHPRDFDLGPVSKTA